MCSSTSSRDDDAPGLVWKKIDCAHGMVDAPGLVWQIDCAHGMADARDASSRLPDPPLYRGAGRDDGAIGEHGIVLSP